MSRVVSVSHSQSIFCSCHFIDNLSAVNGSIYLAGGYTLFKEIIFVNNTAVSKSELNVMGGAIYSDTGSFVEIWNCSFEGNRASSSGGAIFSSGKKLIVELSVFKYNTLSGENGCGGAISLYPTVKSFISKCSFDENSATDRGGAIFNGGKELLIKSSFFADHTATDGGAIFSSVDNVMTNISNSSFKGNKLESYGVVDSGGDGGAIFFLGKKLFLTTSSFESNNASYRGGAISVIFIHSHCEISLCSFKGNDANNNGGANYGNRTRNPSGGGAIMFFGKQLIIKASFFFNNSADEGGAIYFMADEKNRRFNNYMFYLIIDSSSFNMNYAGYDGGALATGYTLKSNITNCSFMNNNATTFGGAIRFYGNELLIETSSFQNNSGKIAGAVYFFADDEDYLTNYGYRKAIKFKLLIKSSNFSSNSARNGGGALAMDSKLSLINSRNSGNFKSELSSCFFKTNRITLQGQGGAIKYVGKELSIDSSHFHDNRALGIGGEAGALYVNGTHSDSSTINIISNSNFTENRAAYRGGAVMVQKMTILIKESIFSSSSYLHGHCYVGGEFLYSLSKVTLEYVSFNDSDKENNQNSLIIHLDFERSIFIGNGVQITCSKGKGIELFNLTNNCQSGNQFTTLVVSCSFCTRNLYSLTTGRLHSTGHSLNVTNNKCYECPFGGLCEKSKVQASDNLWGYIYKDKVQFSTCPQGYCCVKNECKNYSSCHKGRRGNLCGQCEQGLTENLVTPDCLLHQNCRHPLFSLIAAIIGIGYVLVFTYIDKIMSIAKASLVPGFIMDLKFRHSGNLSRFLFNLNIRQQYQYITNDVTVEEPERQENSEQACNYIELSLLKIRQNSTTCNNNKPSVFLGLLKILIFFYQVNVMFKTYTGTKSHRFVHNFQEVVFTLFNLRTDGIFSQELSWCPIDGLRPVWKILLKNAFAIYLFILIIMAFLLLKIGKQMKIIGIKNYQLHKSRLLCCSLRFILISYAGITSACFSLLFCVQLGPYGNVLYIDGSVACYKWWQMAVSFVVCFWICPLPFAIYTSSKLLHNQTLSARSFLLCLIFPLPAILYWLYIWIHYGKKGNAHLEQVTPLCKSAQEALAIMEGPFRKVRNGSEISNSKLSWESILITRKLILIFIKTFVINVFLRLSLMLLCMTVYFGHHIYSKPFSSNLLNTVDTISLLILTVICFLNLAPAYNHAYLSGSNIHVQSVIQTFQKIENVLTLVFPFVIGLCVTFLILIRIFQFLVWICRCFMRIIIYIMRSTS